MATIKFSEEICAELCQAHEEGLPQKDCADLVGIHRNTIQRWLSKGENAKSGKYRDFYINWNKAHAKFKRFHIGEINKSKFWQAHQYMLQVSDPDTFVVAEKQQVESKVEAEVKADAEVTMESVFDIVDKSLGLDE